MTIPKNGGGKNQARPAPPALVHAAQAFAEELHNYAQLSGAFQRAPLVSAKHLERINETLSQIAACEQRLGVCGQALAAAVAEARDEQEGMARATLERIPAIKARTEELGRLLGRFDQLGREAATVNEIVGPRARNPEAGASDPEIARELAAKLQALAKGAQEVTADARAAEFEELANQGHGLYQQLASALKKLALAHPFLFTAADPPKDDEPPPLQ